MTGSSPEGIGSAAAPRGPAPSNLAAARAEALSRSAIARAAASERFFWWRVVALLGLCAVLGWFGIERVKQRSAGIRTAHQLARVHDQLREQVEVNRRLETRLIGKKEPVELAREAKDKLKMRSPRPGEQVEVQ